MFTCKGCGGTLLVTAIEEYPEGLKNKLEYDRLCDVACVKCGKVYYSQPYDFGKFINEVRTDIKSL